MKTQITKESLEAFGMKITKSPLYPMSKVLGKSHNGELTLVVSRAYNADNLALIMPEGSALYINAQSIEDLEKFESMIASYEPAY